MLEIIVVSDHSDDGTDDIVRGYADQGVVLLSQPERMGKTIGLNAAVNKARGEVIVFTDADAMYEPDAIVKILEPLSDPKVCLVTGSTRYVAEGSREMVKTSSVYTDLEKFIKLQESRTGSCVGADGAIFGMRKSLYQSLKKDDINDFVLPLLVVKKGFRVVFHKELYCYEASSVDSMSEYQRQIRITNRTLRALFRYYSLFNPIMYPMFSFKLISHKLIRFCVPVFLVVIIPVNIVIYNSGIYYKVSFVGQIIFYVAALLGYISSYSGKILIFRVISHFVVFNIAILMGWYKYIIGETQVTWSTK